MAKKIVRWVAVGVGIVIVVVVAGAFFMPRHPVVSRSIEIAEPAATVFPLVSDLRRFNDWSPWFDRDPNAAYTFTGPTDGVGQTFHWKSDKPEVGSGSMTVQRLDPNKEVEISLEFTDRGTATTWIDLEPDSAGTKVAWKFSTDLGFNPVDRYFGLMFDGLVGPDYERGLARLKTLAETPPEPPARQ